ncbi:hypothetical protein F0U61_10415 [Archangium violaceum]|nr:hypothetical protein F0U61_10415 [Archangium violaceum]
MGSWRVCWSPGCITRNVAVISISPSRTCGTGIGASSTERPSTPGHRSARSLPEEFGWEYRGRQLRWWVDTFLKRVAALVPPPGSNLVRFHGVFAPGRRCGPVWCPGGAKGHRTWTRKRPPILPIRVPVDGSDGGSRWGTRHGGAWPSTTAVIQWQRWRTKRAGWVRSIWSAMPTATPALKRACRPHG